MTARFYKNIFKICSLDLLLRMSLNGLTRSCSFLDENRHRVSVPLQADERSSSNENITKGFNLTINRGKETMKKYFGRILKTAAILFLLLILPMLSTAGADRIFAADLSRPSDALDHPELQAGLEAWMTGDIKNCERLIRIACDKEPNLAPPQIILALLYSNAGKYVQMREYLESAANEYPEDPEAYLQMAGIAFRDKRYTEAKLLVEHGNGLFKIYEEKSKADKINNKDRINYLRHEYLSLLASLANKKNDVQEAERLIRKLLESEPDDDETLASLGYLLFLQKKYEEAEKIFDKARTINAARLPGWLTLAHMMDNSGKTEEAKKMIESHFTPESTRYEFVPPVVRLLMKWNRMDEAEKYIVKLQKDAAQMVSTWTVSGEYALYKHQYYPAEEAFQHAVLLDPKNAEANNGLALALADQSNKMKMKQALEMAKKNWVRNPDSTEYKVTYAWILFLAGDKDEANAFFAPMLESGKMTQTAAYYLAEIANGKGNQSLALNLLDIALEQETNFPKREAAEELRKIIDKDK